MIRYLIACLSLLSFITVGATKTVDRILVVLHDEPILESDLEQFQQKLKSKSFQELFGSQSEVALKDKSSALSLLVEERLINHHVKKLDLAASEQEVQGQINGIARRNGITQTQLAERLKQLGTSFDEYKEGIKRQLERKNLMDREIRPTTEVTEEQLRHYFSRNLNPNDGAKEYKVSHILFEFKSKTPTEIQKAKSRADKVYAELLAHPEDFEKWAKESSDDPETRESGGSLGFLSPNGLSREFSSVITKMKPGGIGKPTKLADGFHILKLVELRDPDFSSLSKERREALRIQLLSEEIEKKMSLWLDRKKREANIRRFDN